MVRDRDGNEIPNVCEAPGSEDSSARPDGITQVIIPTGILNTVLELFKKDMDCDATSDSVSEQIFDSLNLLACPLLCL